MRETANQFIKAGWDVTVVTIAQESWERDSGVDLTLLDQVDPLVNIVELPLAREDLETDIRLYSEDRALKPNAWVAQLRARQTETFPEANFGEWRGALEQAVLDIHEEHQADLLLASCVPYVNLAAAWKLWEHARVPYAVDFRDGWSIDVIEGVEAFSRDSELGRWERKILDHAVSLWVVNDPIAEHYRSRYPDFADRVRVVRNGYDADSSPGRAHKPDPESGLVFGYLGTVNFTAQHLETVLNAWRAARSEEPLLANSRFEVRGHIGNGAGREANRHAEILKQAEADGVRFGGPAAKAEVASIYAGWDAMVLILIGGRFVTSGKVYEYMATGLPIVSAHVVEHDASNVLAGHPLWTGAVGLDEEALTQSFIRAAHMAVETSDAVHAEAMAHADQFTREVLMTAAVRELIDQLATDGAPSTPATDTAVLAEKSIVTGGTAS
ncbi:Glycosyltransferase involved in cell wall bisynthesis [Streptomyces sp. LamerLS-316]|uniref:glycosyltransferase n=1 Tax=unclassified Streptomyces TaxID=2593676 RepID=UPI00082382F6|nr:MULTISPECIES: glycosyltransferase [unclassified Streptomyces]SCK13756.1 Glycosyltransferase involved in cell wall bisynthesis [Streptomyces sp. LamerLS-316]